MNWWQITLICVGAVVVWGLLSALLYKVFFKRFYDIVLSFIAIIVFSPLLLILTAHLVNDQILKFARTVPEEKTYFYYDLFCKRLKGKVEPTTSGHGSIDLIVPGCHKASGLKRLVERWKISSEL